MLQRKQKSIRAFQGVAGSPLATTSSRHSKQFQPSALHTVLIHFCFDQVKGESKKDSCPCKQRMSREQALALIKNGQADWLLVRNAKSATGMAEFQRAIVIRSQSVAGEQLYAIKPPLNRRDKKHEQIRQTVRADARKILQVLFAKGVIESSSASMSDEQLDELLGTAEQADRFLTRLAELGQKALHKKFVAVIVHWWNNVLGFYRLNADAGLILTDTEQGTGRLATGFDVNRVTEDFQLADSGRVAVANHRASKWSGGWDYSTGADPLQYVRGDDTENE
jgi:hypothetical protein